MIEPVTEPNWPLLSDFLFSNFIIFIIMCSIFLFLIETVKIMESMISQRKSLFGVEFNSLVPDVQ